MIQLVAIIHSAKIRISKVKINIYVDSEAFLKLFHSLREQTSI